MVCVWVDSQTAELERQDVNNILWIQVMIILAGLGPAYPAVIHPGGIQVGC